MFTFKHIFFRALMSIPDVKTDINLHEGWIDISGLINGEYFLYTFDIIDFSMLDHINIIGVDTDKAGIIQHFLN